jgi:hypothetical protein
MNGYLTIDGELMKGQLYAHCVHSPETRCGARCVAFRDPIKLASGMTALTLCSNAGTILFDEFSDERLNFVAQGKDGE